LLGGGLVAYLGVFEFPLDPKVYLIDHLPVLVNGSEFVITAVVAIVICTTATVAPSAWAARMLPVEGLRYE
ncbi:MAG: ABC transporter permease, partial [Myxococcota bacterium]